MVSPLEHSSCSHPASFPGFPTPEQGSLGTRLGLYDVHVTTSPSPDVADVRYGLDRLQVAKTEAGTLAYDSIFIFQ